ncbi:MAG TPA: hypothetical protein VL463_20095 [Kofleriaceae bacterium]|nr:hypothetical protein [Kofleriaceae bacterium]
MAGITAACGGGTGVSDGTATVQLDPRGGWSGSAEVLVHHADGSMVSRAPITTTAKVAVESGDTVTVAFHDGTGLRLASSSGIEPGDSIHWIAAPMSTANRVEVAVHVPTVAGATQWIASTPGSLSIGSGSGLSVDVDPGTTSIPVLAVASANDDTLGMYGDRAAPIANSAVELNKSVAWQPTTISAAHATGEVSKQLDLWIGDDDVLVPALGTGTTIAIPTDFADRVGVVVGTSTKSSFTGVGSVTAGHPGAQVAVDLALPDLPTFSQGAVAADHVSWNLDGGGDYDVISVNMSASAASYEWTIDAPPGSASVVLPKLPADLASAKPYDSVWLDAFERSDLAGYSALIDAHTAPAAGSHWEYRAAAIVTATSVAAPADHGKLDPRALLAHLRR